MYLLFELTFVDDGLFLAEIGESRKLGDAILFGQAFVVDLDEIHAEGVRIVVDLFEFLKHLVAGGATPSVYCEWDKKM